MKHLIIAVFMLSAVSALADHDNKAAIDKGSYVQTAQITGSSTTGTAFLSPNAKRVDGLLFNNTSSTIWIGTTTATLHNTTHSNIGIGIPVLSSATFSLGGIMSDVLYFTCGIEVATCDVRTIQGLNR